MSYIQSKFNFWQNEPKFGLQHDGGIADIGHDCEPAQTGNELAQQFEALASKIGVLEGAIRCGVGGARGGDRGVRKRQEGEAKNVMLGAFAGHYDVKHVVVVDEDVDIHNPTEVEWAVATRFQADRDLVIVPESQGSKLDPSTRSGVGAKMGLDATKPLDAAEMRFKRIRVPGEENVEVAALLATAGTINRRDAVSS
jgi:3-octaprenyl-4-hydroxybenzoate carboxy-lyase C-terminal domain